MQPTSINLAEKGRGPDGSPIELDRRLFMQLLAFGDCQDETLIASALEEARIEAVLYRDINDPQGIGLLTLSESPNFFVETLRTILSQAPFTKLTPKPEYTMLGRTYTIGYEQDLEHVLLRRSRERVFDTRLDWAVWYPVRRAGSFEQLTQEEQRQVLMEHGTLGSSFGAMDYGYDVRLACHGIDKNDNDFVIGLIGKDLYPLSALVQAMRHTQQTSKHLENLGPFFVGKAFWHSHPHTSEAPA